MPEDIKRIEKILKARQQTTTGTPVITSLDDLVRVDQAIPNGIQSFDDLMRADTPTNQFQRPAAQQQPASGTESQIDRLAREFDFTNQNDQADLPSPDQIDMESVATKFPELFDDYHKYRKEGLSHESALNVARSKVKGKITYDKKSPWDDPEYHGYKNLRGGMSNAAVVKELYPHLFPNYSKYIDAGVPHDVALLTAKADYVDIDQMIGPQPVYEGPPAPEEAFGPEDSIGGPLGPIKRGLFTTKERFVTSPFKMAPSVLSGPISLVSPRLGEKIYNELEPVVRKSTDLQSELLYAYHQPPQSTGKYARPAESWKEYLDPKRVYNIAGENAPLMGAFIISNLLTPAMAPIVMGTIEGSETVDRIRQYEDRTGKKVDPRFKIFAPIVVGSINAMLEKLGIDMLLGKYPILGKKILGILASPVVESMTEFDQALMQVLAEALYGKEVDQSVVDYIYSKKDEMREEAMGGYILGLMGAPGSIMADEAVSTKQKTKKFLFEITPELLKEQRRKLKRFLDDEVLYGKVYRVNGQEYIERNGMLILLKEIKGMPRSHLRERLEQGQEKKSEPKMEDQEPQKPQQIKKEEKKDAEEEFLTILDETPPESFAEEQKPEGRTPAQSEVTPISPDEKLKRRKTHIPVKMFMSNVVKAREKGQLDFDYRSDLEDMNDKQLKTIREWLTLYENDPVHRQLLDEIDRIQGKQKSVPEGEPVPEPAKPAEPAPEPPPTVEKPNIEPRAVFEEKGWNRTPNDDQAFWNDAMSHVAEIEEQIKGELENLQNYLENLKGKRDRESQQKRKMIKSQIQDVLQDAYDLDAYYQDVVVRHREKTQQEALQRAREAGIQEEHIEDFVIEFMEEISQEQPYLEHNYDRSYEEIFNNLLNDYREGNQTGEQKEPAGPVPPPPELRKPVQPEKPTLSKPEQKPPKEQPGKKELKRPEKPKPSPEEIERDLIDRRNRINEGIDLRRKESNDFIFESQKLAAEHGYELRLNRSRKKAGLYKDGKKVIARPQVKMNQRVTDPLLMDDIPRLTREKIKEILHQLGADIDVEGLSKDQIRAAIKDIKTDKGKEATFRAQKTINELLDALEKGYVDIKSNRGLYGGKLERNGIPVRDLLEDLPPDRMLEEAPEPEKLPPEAVAEEELALMKEDKDWQDKEWEKEKKRLQRPEKQEKPHKQLKKPQVRIEKTPAGDQIVPKELRPQAEMPKGKIDRGPGKPVEDIEGGLFGQEKEKAKRESRLFGDQEGRIKKGDRVRIKKTGKVHEVIGVEEYRGKQIVHTKDEKGYRHKFSPAEIEPAGPEKSQQDSGQGGVKFQFKAEPLNQPDAGPETKPDTGRKADILPFEAGIEGEGKDLFDFSSKKKSKLSGAVKELMDSYGPGYVREMYDIAYHKALNGVINGIKLENVRPTDYKLKALRYEQDRAFQGFLKNLSYIQDFYAQKTEIDDSRNRAAGKPVSYANRVLTFEKVKGDFPEIIPFYRQMRKDVEAVKRRQKQKIMDREFKYLQRRFNTFSRTDILADWSRRAAEILKRAVKGVDVVTDPDLFKAKAAEYGHNYQDDLGIYDEREGKIYINPEFAEKDTVFHEFAHPVVDHIRKNNQKLYRQGLELVKYTPYELRAVLNRYENPLEEALVQAIGEKGAQIQDEVLRNKFIAWLKQVLREVNRAMKQMFGFELTLDEFAGMIAYQMRAGKTIVDLKAAENKIDFISRKEFDRILNDGKKVNLGGVIASPEFNIMNDEYEVSVTVNPGTENSYYKDFSEPQEAYRYIQNLRRKQSQFQFAGPNAQNADKSKLLRANNLEAQGADMSNIRKETGWFKGPDGKWRFEIDDSQLNINAGRLAPTSSGIVQAQTREKFFFGPLGEFVSHPELFKAYPQLKDIELHFIAGRFGKNIGSYNSGHVQETPEGTVFQTPGIYIDVQNSRKIGLDILVHELQHAIQDIEGFARGGSPEAFYVDLKNQFRAAAALYQMAVENENETEKKLLFRQIKKLGFPLENKSLRRALADNNLEKAAPVLDKISKKRYENLAGEIEARDVAARRSLDPVIRALNFEPYTTQKFGDIIIRYGRNGQASFSKGHDDLVIEGEELLDGFFSERDWRNQKASVEALNFQQRIQNTIRRKPGRLEEPLRLKWEKEWQDIDRAIHVYIDMKNNPDHYDEYYGDLKPEQQRIVDLARNLTGEQKRIAEQIRLSYELTGREALDLDIIYSVLENYVGRMWDIGDNPASEFWRKFGTKTRHAKPRVFETILEGWAKGYELKVEGATNNLAVLKNELATVIESKKLIKAGLQIKDSDGNPLFSFQKNEGYLKIEHPNFTWWDYRGSVRIDDIEKDLKDFVVRLNKSDSDRLETAENRIKMILSGAGLTTPEIDNLLYRIKNTPTKEAVIDEFIRRLKKDQSKIRYKKRITSDLMITPFGDILQRVPVYAPEKFAKRLNRTFGQSKLKGALNFGKDDKYSIIDVATKYNAIIKANILQTSLFHHFAFTRSYLFGGAIRNIKDINIFRAYKDGLRAIQELNPTIELLVRNGLTLGRIQDWEELVFRQHTFIGDLLDKWKVSREVKDRVLLFREKQARSLFQRYGAGLKAYTAMLEYQHMLHDHPDLDPNDRAKYVANLVNDDFGGLHLQRLGISPTRQHIFRLFALAPDWTESNIRTMIKAVKAGPAEQKRLYRTFWRRVAVRAMTLTTVLNLAMALFDDPDDDETYWETVKRRYKTAWDRGYLSWLDVDISPVYFALGGDRNKRAYFSVIGHFRDPVKFLKDPWGSAKNKGSVISRIILESLMGSDWRSRPFTAWDELTGLDTNKLSPSYKGVYQESSEKYGYKKGQPKGGKLKYRLTKSKYEGKSGPLQYEQVPSYTIHEIKQMMPIQIQMIIGYFLGEEAGLEALLKSLGIGSAVVTDPAYYKELNSNDSARQKKTLKHPVRSERPVRKRLIRKAG